MTTHESTKCTRFTALRKLYLIGRALNCVNAHPNILTQPLNAYGTRDGTAASVKDNSITIPSTDFFILGASKCGTTSLMQHLMRHSRIAFQTRLGGEEAGKRKRFFCEQGNADTVDALECHVFDKHNASIPFMQQCLRLSHLVQLVRRNALWGTIRQTICFIRQHHLTFEMFSLIMFHPDSSLLCC